MKAISLTQPWATLVAMGAKEIETRSWSTAYRGRLAVHAAKGLKLVGGKDGLLTLCMQSPFREALHDAGDVLPLGAVIATAELYDIRATSYIADAISRRELAFGDYSGGRYAWLLRNVELLPEPVQCKGALGLWEWAQP